MKKVVELFMVAKLKELNRIYSCNFRRKRAKRQQKNIHSWELAVVCVCGMCARVFCGVASHNINTSHETVRIIITISLSTNFFLSV